MMRTRRLHGLFSPTAAAIYLGLAVVFVVSAHPSSGAHALFPKGAGRPPSPLVATLRLPHARVLQMVPDDVTGRLIVLTQVVRDARGSKPTLESVFNPLFMPTPAALRVRGPQPVTESVFDPRTGRLLRTVTLAPDYAGDSYQVDSRTGRIVFANTTEDNAPNVAHVVDGATGAPLLTIDTGKSPFDMAIDP